PLRRVRRRPRPPRRHRRRRLRLPGRASAPSEVESRCERSLTMRIPRWMLLVVALVALAPPLAAQTEPARVVAAQKVGLSSERLARIGQVVNGEIEKGKLPGAVVLVARRGQIAYFEAFGFQDKAAGKKMARDTIFRVYSMTKPWTSVAAMMLMEEGKL